MLEDMESAVEEQDLDAEPPHARTEFEYKMTFPVLQPHVMTKNEKLCTKFRSIKGCILGSDKCEESSLDCGGHLRMFGSEWMSTPTKVNTRSGTSNILFYK